MRIFVCKLRLHFQNSKHLRCLVCHDIFGNFFCDSEIFDLHPLYTIHASYGPGYRLADWNFSRSPANCVLSSYTSLKKATCRRQVLLQHFHNTLIFEKQHGHMCCDICAKTCVCNNGMCNVNHLLKSLNMGG